MILGASALQVPAIKYAKDLGYEIILIDYDKAAVGFELGDINLVISTLDQDAVLEAAKKYKPDFVMTSTSDGPVRTAAYVNEQLGKRPDLSYEDSKCATIKSFMRDRLKKHHVPIPMYFAVENEEQFLLAVEKLSGKIIVKPADNAGSRGVVLADTADSQEQLLETYCYSRDNARNGLVMVEEYMEGEEVSVEAMTVDGMTTIITITDKLTTPPPFFVELGHSQPSKHSEEVQEQIREVTLQAVKAIGLLNGPSHTEVKITPCGPKIVELAARLGGDFITSKLVPLSTGVDMVGNSVLLATGQGVNLEKKIDKGSAICFIQSKKGVIKELSVEACAYELPGIEEIVLYKKAGDVVCDTTSSNHRLGYIIATGKDGKEATERANEAMCYVNVIYE